MVELRKADAKDSQVIANIYNYYVLNSVVTFDIETSSSSYWAKKIEQLAQLGLPFLVAESAGEVIGFAYASRWREKAAYDQSVEDTIYLSPGATKSGTGTLLLTELIEQCREAGIKQMIAVISAEGAEASIALHERFGFEIKGNLSDVGYKFDRWLGTVLMQKSL